MTVVRRTLCLTLALSFAPVGLAQSDWHLEGFVALRGFGVESQASWLEGGFGRLTWGGDSPEDDDTVGTGKVELAASWDPSLTFGAYVHATARAEPSTAGGDAAGIVEAYLEGRFFLPGNASGVDSEPDRLRLRLGQFFLPTSRENVEPLWSSPYTLTLSSINSWIAEELRPIGLDADYRHTSGNEDEWRAGASLFGGNDTLGTQLAWRGWSFGDRLTTTGEVLPLPDLFSLRSEEILGAQRDDGTKPLGRDLDGRIGWSARLRWHRPDTALLQATWVDNGGDRELHRGEYAWDTSFYLLAGEWQPHPRLKLVSEFVEGYTAMGRPDSPFVSMDFRAAYLLTSWGSEKARVTLRYDHFENVERDGSSAEDNSEEGHAWTAAALWQLGRDWRIGLEGLLVDSDRPAAAQSGFSPDTDALSWTLELRYRF